VARTPRKHSSDNHTRRSLEILTLLDEAKSRITEDIKAGKHAIVYGPHGIGKNYTISFAAKSLGFSIVRITSADNLQEMRATYLAVSQAESLVPTMIVVQDAENIDDVYFLEELATKSIHPVFLVCSMVSRKISPKLKAKFDVIRFPEPRLAEVVAIIKMKLPQDEQIDFQNVTTDIRQSLLNVSTGSSSYKTESTIEELEDLFIRGILSPNLEKHQWLWMLVYGNILNFYSPPDVVASFEILQEAELYNKPQMLTLLPRGRGKATFPRGR
jgi:hypothetical protein